MRRYEVTHEMYRDDPFFVDAYQPDEAVEKAAENWDSEDYSMLRNQGVEQTFFVRIAGDEDAGFEVYNVFAEAVPHYYARHIHTVEKDMEA